MRRINIKNAFVLATGFLLLSGMLGACTSYDYDEEMNNRFKEEARLKAEDEKIKAEIIAAIQSLHTELMQNIETMSQHVDGKLSEKDKEVMGRFTAAEDDLKGLIEARAEQAGVKIEELGTTLTKAITEKQNIFDQALQKAREELEKAIKDGDEANIKKAQDAIDLIAQTEQAVKNAGQKYEERINRLLALETRLADMRAEIEKKEAEKVRILKQAQDFEDEMKNVIQQKIQNFRSSDLAKIKQALADYNVKLAAYNDLDDYQTEFGNLSADVISLTENIEDAINTANELTNSMNEVETALEEFDTAYEEMETLRDEAEGVRDEAMGKVQENLDAIEGALSKIESIRDELQTLVDEMENLNEFILDCVSEAESEAGSVDV